MIGILAFVWGGVARFVFTAVRKERLKSQDSA